ncbi:hypothetical protein LPJ81_001028 [Coemansia sp. IMI 209127]|nr:hypothetical protein LPJ81_001028 [Coemansia sp. IMI 209127]
MSVTHSLPAIRSPVVGSVLQPPPPQQQHHQYQDPTSVVSTAQQYQYGNPQQYTAQSPSVAAPVFNAASAMAQPHQRLLGGYSQQAPGHYGHPYLPPPSHQQLNMSTHPSASVSSSTSVTGAASVGVQHTHLQHQFVSPHTIPSSLLGQSPAMTGTDYGVWLYPHQQMPAGVAANRSVALASVSGAAASVNAISGGDAASSTSVSPVSQHTLAPADSAYPIQGQFDGQMRYMAVPGQTSGVPRQAPTAAVSFPYDRSLRPIAMAGQQHQTASSHPLPNMQQYGIQQQQPHTHPYYYHQHHPQQQQLSHIQFQGKQQHQHDYSAYYQTQHQLSQAHQTVSAQHNVLGHHSPFPTQVTSVSAVTAAAAAAAALSDNSPGHLPPIAASPSNSGSLLHASTYGGVHGNHSGQLSPEHVSAAQMAAAVAAVAASTHAIPASTASSAGSISATNSGAGASGIGIDQSGLSSFKFSVNMPSGSESGLPDYFESYTQNYMVGNQPMLEPSPASPAEQTLDADLIARLDGLFMKYLEAICSNTITVDSEGESIHQTQMAKKLEKLEQCTEYRTFRFRIQAFSNGYREFMEREAGMTEQMVSKQQLRAYLHQQRYISRYNEDGKKAKSKGHHVWNVEAKKISRNTWWFKEFLRRIASPPAKAVVGVPYEWTPTIWDPQIKSPKVYFSSEWLPSWLRWENNSLRGLAPPDATDCSIVVVASYYQGKDICHLKTNFTIHVVQHTPASTTMFMP